MRPSTSNASKVPEGVSLEDVIEAFRDFKPAEKTYEYDYAALKA